MKAWLLNSPGDGVDRLHLIDVPDPIPGPGDVVLDLHYAALNPADRYLAEGQYPAEPPFPHILGRDGFGTVVAVGEDVTSVPIGARRAILRGDTGVARAGTFAQRAAVAAHDLIEAPPGWTEPQAASASLVYLTAHQAISQWGELAPGSVLLITGASGGVGVAATQLGVALGHVVIGLSRSREKAERLKALGATNVLDPHDPQWRKLLKDFLKGRRVDLAIDNIGGTLFSEVLDTLGMWGRVSVVGRLAGPVPEFNTSSLLFRRLRVGGVAVGSYSNPEARAAWEQLVAILARTNATPLVDQVFPFDQLPQAFAALKHGPMGKVLMDVKANG
jgi:NADPH2:quinone reductase